MEIDKRLGGRDVIVTLTAAGRPQSEIAKRAGVSVRTLRRRQGEPGIVADVALIRVELERQAVGRLSDLREQAFARLAGLLGSDDPLVVVRVARLVLDQGLAHRAALVPDEIASLEARVAILIEQQGPGGRR
jgi:hypothetical protein